jgi:hypothetical protein
LFEAIAAPRVPAGRDVKAARLLILIIFAIYVSIAADRSRGPAQAEKKLWAGITVNRTVFSRFVKDPVLVSFSLVNDGEEPVNPEVESSRLLVNGKELEDWSDIIRNGIRDGRWKSLPSKDYIDFTYDLSDHFTKPGVYRLSWKGKGFQADDVVFRVLPKGGN